MAVTELGAFSEAGLAAQKNLHAFLKRLLTEPLIHFLIAGAVLFMAGRFYEQQTSLYRIVVTSQHVAQLANDYALQFGVRPDKQTLEAMVQSSIHDEILLRQARSLKLDQDDEIVRRRIVQKMEFLMQNLNPPAQPTEAQLQAYYHAHASRYTAPPRVTFSHIYFTEGGGARARAVAVRAALSDKTTRAPDRGDPFPDLYDFSSYEPEQVQRLFGHTEFADAVYSVAPGHWAGPFRSAYGWHLIYVDARQPAAAAPLSVVRDKVTEDYLQNVQHKANADVFAKLAQRFTVIRQDKP